MSEEKENFPLFEEELPEEHQEETAPAAPLRPVPSATHQGPHCNSDFFDGGSFGATLKRMREKCGKDLRSISAETKIPLTYLQALENEDCKKLPQPVYVLGFIRKLCSIYGISAAETDELTAGLREKLEYELPADINKSVVDRAFSEENERKLHQLAILLGIAVILIIGALTGGTILIINSLHDQTQEVELSGFNPETLLELQEKPQLQKTELEIP